jgi:hypothetical protein
MPFQTSFTLPPPIQIANPDQVAAIHRDADQVITWDPTGYPSSYTTTVRLVLNNPFFTGPSVICRAPASSGRVVLPAALVQKIPAGVAQYQLQITVTPRPDSVPQFAIPLVGGGTMPSILQYYGSEAIPVTIQ